MASTAISQRHGAVSPHDSLGIAAPGGHLYACVDGLPDARRKVAFSALLCRIAAWSRRLAAGTHNLLRASSRPNVVGPSRCSITAAPPRRLDRLEVGDIEFDNRTQGLTGSAVLLIIGQRLPPVAILGLQLDESSDGVIPPLDPAAPVGCAASANDRCASGVCGTLAGLTPVMACH